MYNVFRLFVRLSAALLAAFFWGGCSEDDLIGNNTTVFGQVIDPAQSPISMIEIAVVYEVQFASPSPSPGNSLGFRSTLTPLATSLGNPYPNPMNQDLAAGQLRIPVSTDVDTTLRVEVLGIFGGTLSTVANVYSGRLASDTTFVWNGRGDAFNNLVANGLYVVRLTMPSSGGTTQDVSVLINRSSNTLANLQEGFNALSDGNGEYVIEDIAVESRFPATSAGGGSLGTGVVGNRISLFFWDPANSYLPRLVSETLLTGETLEKVTELTPTGVPAPEPPSGYGVP
jgi:hypothetical protein